MLANLILQSVQKARSEVGDLAVSFIVKRKTGTSYYNGRSTATYANKPVKGLYDKFELKEIDGTLVRTTDSKIILFIDTNDESPLPEDLIVDNNLNETFQVMNSYPVYAGPQIVLATVHLRK